MSNQKNILFIAITALVLVLSGCGSSDSDSDSDDGGGGSDDSSSVITASLSGIAQKGPFLVNSTVSLCKVDSNILCTSEVIETKVTDNKGSYAFKAITWSGLSKLTISGLYFDEITGLNSTAAVTISAIVEIKEKSENTQNVNVFTHLRGERVKKLVAENKSIEDALQISKEEVQELFNLISDDFIALDLTDFSAGKASVNVELLRISAAISKSINPMSDLGELLEIYNNGGLAAVLESTLYKKLMSDAENVDVDAMLTSLGVESEVSLAELNVAAFARASFYSTHQVKITLFGTEFSSDYPAVSLSTTNLLSIVSMKVSDDKKSIIVDMNETTSCENRTLAFTLDYMTLVDVANPIQTNEMAFNDPMIVCNDEDDTGTAIVVPANQLPIAIIGAEYGNEDQAEKTISVNAGQQVPGLETSYSHDRDPYPFGGITHCQWEDESAVVIKESNDTSCGLYDLTFDTAGIYDYTLTVTDKVGATDSNVIHITVIQNAIPVVAITPNSNQIINLGETLELNATANDADAADVVTLQWMYQKVGTPTQYGAGVSTQFTHLFNELGDYNITVIARDNHAAIAQASILVTVQAIPVNHAPTVTISPAGEKNITLGDNLILSSSANDIDGDTLTTSWKLKNVTASEFIPVANDGSNTGFTYTFDSVGSYLVVVEVTDTNGSVADASISVNVSEPIPKVMTLDDVNITVAVKGNTNFGTQFSQSQSVTTFENPEHGSAEVYLVGGETWHLSFTSTDCFIGQDSFVYQSGDEYGRAYVTITSPSTLTADNSSVSLFNSETIDNVYLTSDKSAEIVTSSSDGDSSLIIIGNEAVHYSYDPDNSFVGNDFFEYRLSETINECLYSATGRVDFDVSELVVETRVVSTCQDPYTIGTELYTTDGTLSGTSLLKDLRPGTSSGTAVSTGFRVFDETNRIGDIQYFTADYSAGETRSRELYETNATAEGTLVHDINTHNVFDGTYLYGASNPSKFTKIDNKLFFIASDSTYDRYGMYKADGAGVERIADNVTQAPVRMLDSTYYFSSVDKNISLNKFNADFSSSEVISSFETDVSGSNFTLLTAVDDQLIYSEYMSSNLWYGLYTKTATDDPVKLTGYEVFSLDYEHINGKVYMIGHMDSYSVASIIETDGTLAGTSHIITFNGDILAMTQLNDKVYFKGRVDIIGEDYEVEINLYELDIATKNVTLISGITYGNSTDIAEHHGMGGMSVVDGKLIYESVNEETFNGEKTQHELLWASDGTALGTVKTLRRDRTSVKAQASDLTGMFELNDAYYFQDNTGKLYNTDFSENGTSLVLDYACDIYPNSFSFEDVTDAEPDTYYEVSMTVEGITYPETKLSIEDGEYSLDNGVTWHTEAATIANEQLIKVRHMSSSEYETSIYTTLNVGERDDTFSSTTRISSTE